MLMFRASRVRTKMAEYLNQIKGNTLILPVQYGGRFPTYTVELYGDACLAISSFD